ncbi:hypothetical protein BDQ17DRAFT_1353072, partial [Cyathus striatus]
MQHATCNIKRQIKTESNQHQKSKPDQKPKRNEPKKVHVQNYTSVLLNTPNGFEKTEKREGTGCVGLRL